MMNVMSHGTLRSYLAGITAALLVLASGSVVLHAQMKVLHVDPKETDSAIEAVHGPHLVLYDPQAASNHRLFVFFVGTGGKAEGSLKIDTAFAKLGYHTIGMDYEDKVLAASCAPSTDIACFDHYREAIVTGAPVSERINVSRADSILNRIQKLLVYLTKQDPDGGWGEFVADGQPVWSRIVVAGHSQGSGHAAYIGKMYKVDKVLMFSGPQDYLTGLDKPAPWQARSSATPQSRYYAFLNLYDPFNVHHQIANCMVLMGLSKPETPTVEPGKAIHGHYQILINTITQQPHGTTMQPEFENVWDYLATVDEEDPGPSTSPSPPQPTPGH
jgi:hypothetical protein